MTTNYRLQYTRTNEQGNTDLDVDISFENADYSKLQDNLNMWLQAIGMQLVVKHKYNEAVVQAQAPFEKEQFPYPSRPEVNLRGS
jgi:hypothetical protein